MMAPSVMGTCDGNTLVTGLEYPVHVLLFFGESSSFCHTLASLWLDSVYNKSFADRTFTKLKAADLSLPGVEEN